MIEADKRICVSWSHVEYAPWYRNCFTRDAVRILAILDRQWLTWNNAMILFRVQKWSTTAVATHVQSRSSVLRPSRRSVAMPITISKRHWKRYRDDLHFHARSGVDESQTALGDFSRFSDYRRVEAVGIAVKLTSNKHREDRILVLTYIFVSRIRIISSVRKIIKISKISFPYCKYEYYGKKTNAVTRIVVL